MKALVTGGTGFIGRELVKGLIGEKYKVRCLVRDDKKIGVLKGLDVEFVYGDMEDYEVFDKATKNIDILFHLAAISRQKNFPRNNYYKINVLGTRKLIESAIKNKVKKFVYCSSISVMGWEGSFPKDENSEYNPNGTYGESKCLGEKEVLYFKDKIHCCIVRPSITYGRADFDGMVYKLTQMIYHKKFLRVGNVENFIHLTGMSNLIEGFVLAGEKGRKSGIYIITDEHPIKFKRLVEVVSEGLGIKNSKLYVPLFIARPVAKIFEKISRSEDPFLTTHKVDIVTQNRAYSIEKAKKDLGYNPKINTEDGVRKIVKEYLEEGVL